MGVSPQRDSQCGESPHPALRADLPRKRERCTVFRACRPASKLGAGLNGQFRGEERLVRFTGRAAGPEAARMIQRRNAAKSRCSV
ncbi:hypothetical protein B5V03_02810 [Bradyrhizobium betae]|uniref:Uncharacterized protein n=1 Tax=Bradyrhizobium betae TaxID=244734 RepID=A0A4Q1VSA6_9BRAD|nr:hypothetical protein B5V03_02810 [Bradyrhizobium betae]